MPNRNEKFLERLGNALDAVIEFCQEEKVKLIVAIYTVGAISLAIVFVASQRHWKCDWAYGFVWGVIPAGCLFFYHWHTANQEGRRRRVNDRWYRNKARYDPIRRTGEPFP